MLDTAFRVYGREAAGIIRRAVVPERAGRGLAAGGVAWRPGKLRACRRPISLVPSAARSSRVCVPELRDGTECRRSRSGSVSSCRSCFPARKCCSTSHSGSCCRRSEGGQLWATGPRQLTLPVEARGLSEVVCASATLDNHPYGHTLVTEGAKRTAPGLRWSRAGVDGAAARTPPPFVRLGRATSRSAEDRR